MRPKGNSVYNISDTEDVRREIAHEEHKFRHNFDSLTPFCACSTDQEGNEHLILHCP